MPDPWPKTLPDLPGLQLQGRPPHPKKSAQHPKEPLTKGDNTESSKPKAAWETKEEKEDRATSFQPSIDKGEQTKQKHFSPASKKSCETARDKATRFYARIENPSQQSCL